MSTERSGALGAGAMNPADSLNTDLIKKAAGAIGAEPEPCPIPQPFLEHIQTAEDVRRIPPTLLPALAYEIRQKIHEAVSRTGGHLASNLGVVELTIALHRIYDFRKDHLVLDVGHQVYTHKLLTGRAKLFHTLRQQGGLSGYPNPRESEYDLFHTAHAGCSVSTVLGLAEADKTSGRDVRSVAVVGDGALTSGVVFEAMNHAGHVGSDVLVVLNDNGCSISPTTGALSATCSDIRVTHFFRQFRDRGREFLEKIPYLGRDASRIAGNVLDAASRLTHQPGSIFMDLGFRYFGPMDGHDLVALEKWLAEMRTITGPKLLHVVTHKGYGLPWAAQDPVTWHGARPYEVQGQTASFKKSNAPSPPAYTKVISDAIIEVAKENPKVVAITAAMPDGTGLINFQKQFPDRYYDVGICEQHAVCFAAALAKGGLRPVVCIYSSFLQRAVDQLMHDVSLQEGLPVVLCLDRAGLVGDDGPTHNGVFDIAYMRSFPHFVLAAPKDGAESAAMVRWAIEQNRPVAIRYPRDMVPVEPLTPELRPIELGKGEILRQGEGIALLGYGATVVESLKAADLIEKEHGRRVTVANARFCKPLDTELLRKLFETHDRVITVEDHQLQNGFGSAVLEEACDRGMDPRKLRRLGIPDRYVEHAPRPWQLAHIGIDAAGIVAAALQ
jgi:1-deoxy-D-xylulose-5-phosphate synthase